jgi:hypothetical protein
MTTNKTLTLGVVSNLICFGMGVAVLFIDESLIFGSIIMFCSMISLMSFGSAVVHGCDDLPSVEGGYCDDLPSVEGGYYDVDDD